MAVIDDIAFRQLLLGHLLRCPQVIEKASNVLDPDDFNQAGEQTYRLVWSISKNWYATNHSTIPRNILEIELRSSISTALSMFSPGEVDELWKLLGVLYSWAPEEFSPEWAIEHLQTFLDERKLKPLLQQAAATGAGDDFNKIMDTLKTTQASNRITSYAAIDCFDKSRIRITSKPTEPTGVNYIDRLLDGGT